MLFWYFDVCRGVLAHGGVIVPHRTEHVRNELVLPGKELEGLAVFLASEASDFINGQVIYIDGGISAYIGQDPSNLDESRFAAEEESDIRVSD